MLGAEKGHINAYVFFYLNLPHLKNFTCILDLLTFVFKLIRLTSSPIKKHLRTTNSQLI